MADVISEVTVSQICKMIDLLNPCMDDYVYVYKIKNQLNNSFIIKRLGSDGALDTIPTKNEVISLIEEYTEKYNKTIQGDQGDMILQPATNTTLGGVKASVTNETAEEAYGTKVYPIVISNGLLSYDTGSISGIVLDDEFENTGIIDSAKTNEKKRKLKDFLADKKPKILRDWTGAKWLVAITDDMHISYAESSGLRVPSMTITWTEIGNADDQNDLYYNGIIDVSS